MKLITTTALALLACGLRRARCGPIWHAAARSRSRAPRLRRRLSRSGRAAADQASGKALKALVDLQTAVNSKDTANIPAKLAAAQAVARPRRTATSIGSCS